MRINSAEKLCDGGENDVKTKVSIIEMGDEKDLVLVVGAGRPLLGGEADGSESGLSSEFGSEEGTEEGSGAVKETSDPWLVVELQDTSLPWSELNTCARLRRVFVHGVGKLLCLLALLYFFVCSLDLLSSAFRLLGGRAAGAAFSNNELLNNPVAGLMIGVLATVLVQSSSTSTSIVVTMVASGILGVQPAIPIIMGANIGTSVTNTIVSLAQSPNREEFRRAFGGATVHDMFNWLTVIILLPIECATGYLFYVTSAIVNSMNLDQSAGETGGAGSSDMLQTITKPFTKIIIQLDKNVIEGIALNDPKYADSRLMKVWCGYKTVERDVNVTESWNLTESWNSTDSNDTITSMMSVQRLNVSEPIEQCTFLFNVIGLDDTVSGVILLIASLGLLVSCLVLMVKLLNSALKGRVMTLVKRAVNAELPGPAKYFSGYVAMVVGASMTIVVQSSSVFTSALTPLVGVGVVSLERMYPLTLGSNIGTTTTGMIAAMAAPRAQLRPALQIALVHLLFNITGILMFYPVPVLRVPIGLAKMMGNTTAKYRWFAVLYVVLMFFLLPLLVFSMSMVHIYLMVSVVTSFLFLLLVVIIINMLQRRRPNFLPKFLRHWDFLPACLHSLKPLDRKMMAVTRFITSLCCCCRRCSQKLVPIPTDDDSSEKIPVKKNSPIYRPKSDQSIDTLKRKQSADSIRSVDSECKKLFVMDEYTPKAILNRDCESGYASMTTTPFNTPAATPCMSRLQSFAVIPEYVISEEREGEGERQGERERKEEAEAGDAQGSPELDNSSSDNVVKNDSTEKR